MNVLVTGGTGVIGKAVVRALLERGHTVRLLSRHAEEDAREWPGGVEAFAADIADRSSLTTCADGCDAVLHIAGIVDESPPELTFEAVNVEGTRRIVEEATRAGIKRLLFVSSLGVDRGDSAYHRSKLAAEEEVQRFGGEWVIARPGAVVGPGDQVVSLLLQMVRSLPAIPLVDDGNQPFQPVWHEDLGLALTKLLESGDISSRVVELAGEELTSMNDVIGRLSEITGRDPVRVPVPAFLASAATRLAAAAGLEAPVKQAQIQMLLEGNVVQPPGKNALPELLDGTPTGLDAALRQLVDSLPEQLPGDGVGDPLFKRFHARIENSTLSAEPLCSRFRERWAEVVPLTTAVEPREVAEIREGGDLTIALAGRGTVQVRCEQITNRSVTLATLEGHPLAGVVHFAFRDDGDDVLFEIVIYARAADVLDLLAMTLAGEGMQNRTWRQTVEAVVALSGGSAPEGVHSESQKLDSERAERMDERMKEMVLARRREGAGRGAGEDVRDTTL